MILILFCGLAFFLGVIGASLAGIHLITSFYVIFFTLMFWKPKWAFVFLSFIAGIFRVQLFETQTPHDVPWNEVVTLEGKVLSEVDRRSDHQNVTLKTEWGKLRLKFSLYEEIKFGDLLTVKGVLDSPPAFEHEAYQYADHLALHRIWLVMPRPQLIAVQRSPPSFFSAIFDFKSALEARIQSLYFEPEASFAAGLLLGSRKGLPEELTVAFQRSGLSHIVAISGYNISLLVAALFYVLSFLNFKKRIVLSSFGILIFVILVGASAAVLRAGLMGLLTLWGLYAGRKSQALFGLFWSAVFMTLVNPYTPVYDIGFQLSFAATAGILLFHPLLTRVFPEWEKYTWIRESLLLTISAQITTTPFILFYFGRFSLLSPLTNLLAAPLIPLAMLFSGLSLIFGKTLAMTAWIYLKAIELLALSFSKIPFVDFAWEISGLEFFISLIFLALILIGFYKSTLLRAFGYGPEGGFYRAQDRGFEKHEKQ